MADVQHVPTRVRTAGALAFSLVLALALAAVPLQRLAAAAHDPVRAGAGMGTRVPLLLEAGARSAVASPTSGGIRAALPTRHVHAPWAGSIRHIGAAGAELAGSGPAALLLRIYGRLQLEGG